MREYETVFIVQPEISDEGRQALVERLDGVLDRHRALRFELDDWGKRKLAYEIRKFQKGHYMVLHYAHDGAVVPDLERSMRLDESVLRFLTVQVTDEIADLEERKKDAEEKDRLQRQRAAERAARESEEKARAAARAEERKAEAGERGGERRDEAGERGGERSGERRAEGRERKAAGAAEAAGGTSEAGEAAASPAPEAAEAEPAEAKAAEGGSEAESETDEKPEGEA